MYICKVDIFIMCNTPFHRQAKKFKYKIVNVGECGDTLIANSILINI